MTTYAAITTRSNAWKLVKLVLAGASLCHAPDCLAQTTLRRITINGMPAEPGLPNDPPHHGVELVAGDQRVWFDELYGGCARFWFRAGDPLTWQGSFVYPHMGAAMQMVAETGQDSTQGTGGLTQNPVYISSDPATQKYNYYVREQQFTPPSPQDPRAIYEVRGFGPFFWISVDPIDDAICNLPASGWRTGYTASGRPKYLTGITFDPASADRADGAFFVGNQWAYAAAPWNQRLAQIDGGRVAFKTRIDLTEAGSQGFGGALFRKSIPSANGAGVNDALGATGYHLFVNKAGVVDLWRVAGTGQTLLLHSEHGAPQAGTRPVQMEVQTHNLLPGWMRVLIDDVEVGIVEDPSPLLGPHFGYYAFGNGGKVHFFDRNVYDVGIEFRARWIGNRDGTIVADTTITSAFPSIPEHYFIPSDMGMWANPDYAAASLDTMAVLDSCGAPLQGSFLNLASCHNVPTENFPNPLSRGAGWLGAAILQDGPGIAKTFYIGNAELDHGIYMTPLAAYVNDVPAPAPYGVVKGLGAPSGSGSVISGMSALEFAQLLPGFNCGARRVQSHRCVAMYSLQPPVFDMAPQILAQPQSATTCPLQSASFELRALGAINPTYQWEVMLPNSQSGWQSVNDGLLLDSSGAIAQLEGCTTERISVFPVSGRGDGLWVRCTASAACGSATSAPARLNVCAADFNCDGGVDGSDVAAFFQLWSNGDDVTDLNTDGGVDGNDVGEFFGVWANGC